MREQKGIQIKGSLQKRKLRYMGYFHGYKGYRFCSKPANLLPYKNFNELQAVYDFDMKLKALLYPRIMSIETTLKNYVLEIIIDKAGSSHFADIYSKLLNNYKEYAVGSDAYKSAIIKRMNLRNKIYSTISRDYDKNLIVGHYYDKDKPVPVWAIFELISLGEFGNFLSCLNKNIKLCISKAVGIKSAVDTDGMLTNIIVYTIKDLRNAVAHNNTVFDTRFKTGRVSGRISGYIMQETGISNINFDTIVDYVILISFVMNLLKYNKSDIKCFVNQFENACEELRKEIPINIYSKIIHTNTRGKLKLLKNSL